MTETRDKNVETAKPFETGGITVKDQKGLLDELIGGRKGKPRPSKPGNNDNNNGDDEAKVVAKTTPKSGRTGTKEMTEKEVEKEIRKNKEFAEKKGRRLFHIKREIREITEITDYRISPTSVRNLVELQIEKKEIFSEARKRGIPEEYLKFSCFHEGIVWARENPSKELINEIIARLLNENEKRAEKVLKKEEIERLTKVSKIPNDVFRWLGECYRGLPDSETKKVSPGTIALIFELKKAISAETKRYLGEKEEMKKHPSISEISDIKPKNGLYSGFVPGGNRYPAGCFITVKVVDKRVFPITAIGTISDLHELEILFQRMEEEESYINTYSLSQDRLKIKEWVPDQEFKDLLNFWHALKHAKPIK